MGAEQMTGRGCPEGGAWSAKRRDAPGRTAGPGARQAAAWKAQKDTRRDAADMKEEGTMRETEKIHRMLQEFIDAHVTEDMDGDEIKNMLNEHLGSVGQMPAPVTPATAKTADDYVELAEEEEDSVTARKYIDKALKLDPDNLDAIRMSLDAEKDPRVEILWRYEKALKRGDELMEAQGFMEEECKGKFWGFAETRPYMRLRENYLEKLIHFGMMRRAAEEGERMLELCENDNLGIRYMLMHVYVMLEDEERARKLLETFEGECRLMMGASFLYFKFYQLDTAKLYLKEMCKLNKDTRKFFRAMQDNDLDTYVKKFSPYGYRPGTIEEYIMNLMECGFAYLTDAIEPYVDWAVRSF